MAGELAEGVRARDPRMVSRAITLVENEAGGFEQLIAALHPHTGHAHRIGITGPPGAGKSTLTSALVSHWRRAGLRVAVIAVDPTSPVTGGALLGDRIRLENVAMDDDVFIRSMATRGALGGLAVGTREVCDVLDAAGYERIVVETVGVGQSELDVAATADTTVVVLVPESGDGIQTLKAGLMEIAEVFAVNKADRPGADQLVREIELSFALREGRAYGRGRRDADPDGWAAPLLATVATSGDGVTDLAGAIDRHRAWLESTGALTARRRSRLAEQLRSIVDRAVRRAVWRRLGPDYLARMEDRIASGQASPYDIAREAVRDSGVADTRSAD